jgi:hypothetical protein
MGLANDLHRAQLTLFSLVEMTLRRDSVGPVFTTLGVRNESEIEI